MEIHNHGSASRIHSRVNQPSQSADNVDRSTSTERTDQVNPSSLLERLEGDAEVRERLLVEVKAKFQAGQYSTDAAIEQAAQSIVE